MENMKRVMHCVTETPHKGRDSNTDVTLRIEDTSNIECPICRRRYTSSRNIPLKLPCGKTICKCCIEQWHKYCLSCPFCRVCKIDGDLDVDENVLKEADSLLNLNYCGHCEKNVDGGYTCSQCGILCNDCHAIHERFRHRFGFDHSIESDNILCVKHGRFKVDYFCKNCIGSFCKQCIYEHHRKHDYEQIQENEEAIHSLIAILQRQSSCESSAQAQSTFSNLRRKVLLEYDWSAFPRAEYISESIRDFSMRLQTKLRHYECLDPSQRVTVLVIGGASEKNISLISRSKGKEIPDPNLTETKHGNSRCFSKPDVLAYFIDIEEKDKDVIGNIMKKMHERAHYGCLVIGGRATVEGLLSGSTKYQSDAFMVVERRKSSIRDAISSLLEKPIFKYLRQIKESLHHDTSDQSLFFLEEAIALMKLDKRMPERCPSSTEEKLVPTELANQLFGVTSVTGFGIWNGKFRICTKSAMNDYGDETLENMKESFPEFFKTWSMEIIKCGPFRCSAFHRQGETIYTNEVDCTRNSGTLGGFALNDQPDDNLYALSCYHVIPKEGDKAFIKTNNSFEELGECIFSNATGPRNMCDLSIIEVNNTIKDRCDRTLKDEKDEEKGAKIYQGKITDLGIVFKRGAQTSLTKGFIVSPEFYMSLLFGRKNVSDIIIFRGVGGQPFANRGDSGSLVLAHDGSYSQRSMLVVGMISHGDFAPRDPTNCELDHDFENLSMGFSIKDAFGIVKEWKDLDLKFHDENHTADDGESESD